MTHHRDGSPALSIAATRLRKDHLQCSGGVEDDEPIEVETDQGGNELRVCCAEVFLRYQHLAVLFHKRL